MNEDRIIKWIKRKVSETGAKGIVIGLSGGIDSSLAAALCRKAVGKNMLGLIMPCHSKNEDISDAIMLANMFDIRIDRVNLSIIHDLLVESYLKTENRIAIANIKPRLRMTTLYYYANSMNYLVCGTGNRSEIMTGYFTKYGDGGVDILPLAGLYKKQIVEMAVRMGIPERIIERPPSAGLWDGQTDEQEMGMAYSELDRYLEKYEKGQKLTGKRGQRVTRMIQNARHKLCLPSMFEYNSSDSA